MKDALDLEIIKTKLDNVDQKSEYGNPSFKTEDAVFLVSDEEAKKQKVSNGRNLQKSATDYAVMCGAELNVYSIPPSEGDCKTLWWSRSAKGYVPLVFDSSGECINVACSIRNITLAPALNMTIASFLKNAKISVNGTQHTATIGLHFPKTYVGDSLNEKFNRMVSTLNSDLVKTGASYVGFLKENGGLVKNLEFEYNGDKYVEVEVKKADEDSVFVSGEKCPHSGSTAWAKVEPIEFIILNWDNLSTCINPKGNSTENFVRLETREGIIAGIPFNHGLGDQKITKLWQNSIPRAYLNGYDLQTEIQSRGNGNAKYVNTHNPNFENSGFLTEASQGLNASITFKKIYELDGSDQTESEKNPYGFEYSDLSNDETLKEYIKTRVPVFLHGVSGVGKSTRVKEIDPDATRITLRPGMNAEEVDGTLDRETGKYIPPLWYQQISEKCKKEPDKMHVLFIDEITNVKPTVQSLIYSIVLERAGKDGLWPLPENCVVVGAGNETAGNLSAYPLTNALFRRFCHIYYEVDKNEWLKWATGVEIDERQDYKQENVVDENDKQNRARIHPAIVAFISSRKDDVLYQELDEEEPQIVTDPRKWEIASNVLYSTKNPKALVPAIGRELTADFTEFVSGVVITLRDVLSHKYDEKDLSNLTLSQRLSTIASLSMATQKDVFVVREFVSKNFGKELLATFDTMWIKNDPERALTIQSFEQSIMGFNLSQQSTDNSTECAL